jgi:hypothetical protein
MKLAAVHLRTAFFGVLGHLLTHHLVFTVLFSLVIQHGAQYPFYILFLMSGKIYLFN